MHGGREAVQIFFVISGFYMQLILGGDKYTDLREFYRSRALRIFVPYFVVLLLVLGLSFISGLVMQDWLTLTATVDPGGTGSLGALLAGATNFSIFGQDWVMYFEHENGESLRFTSNYWYSRDPLWRFLWIPQAWSVGIELTFYIIAPLLARRLTVRMLLVVVALSMCARFYLYAGFNLAHDPWTYRFFPFELACFAIGMLGCRLYRQFPDVFKGLANRFNNTLAKLGSHSLAGVAAAIVALMCLHAMVLGWARAYAESVHGLGGEMVYLVALIGWLPLIPLLFVLTLDSPRDRFVGELSYPVYLFHYSLALFLYNHLGEAGAAHWLSGEITAIASIFVVYLLQVKVLLPFENWRQRSIAARRTSGNGERDVDLR